MANNTFYGYERKHGKVGTRNHLVVVPTVFCVNEVAERISRLVPGARALTHSHGCCELKPDLDRVTLGLRGLIKNSNVGGCIVVSLGCEGVSGDELLEVAHQEGKPAMHVNVHQEGGINRCISRCLENVQDLQREVNNQSRKEMDAAQLIMGIKCGSSDATSGLSANAAVGVTSDLLLDKQGTVIFGETTEFIGAESILAKRCETTEIKQRLLNVVERMENRIKRVGVDIRGSQPTPGNIEGGLTTIEEKSLGAINKSGSKPIKDVLEYTQEVYDTGLFVLDSPGKEDEIMTALAISGANIITFATGGGAPQGLPIVPVLKIAGNPEKCLKMKDHIDIDASGILLGNLSIEEAGEQLFKEMLEVASGKESSAELLGYDRTIGFYVNGPTI